MLNYPRTQVQSQTSILLCISNSGTIFEILSTCTLVQQLSNLRSPSSKPGKWTASNTAAKSCIILFAACDRMLSKMASSHRPRPFLALLFNATRWSSAPHPHHTQGPARSGWAILSNWDPSTSASTPLPPDARPWRTCPFCPLPGGDSSA